MQVRWVRTMSRRSDGSMSRSVGAMEGSRARGSSCTVRPPLVYYRLIIVHAGRMVQTKARKPRVRTVREDIRERLLDAALLEFGDKGFDGASTRAIARRIGAHLPQIHFHFTSKEALWCAALDHLFAKLAHEM